MIKISRALISVADKADIVSLATTLQRFGCEIVSTGGTLRILSQAGINAVDISSFTKCPEAFGGRMKTLSFRVGSAILYDREKDREESEALGIEPFDMVVCNFYPFKDVCDSEATMETLIEHIDIGGPTMVRAAAKNYKYVAAVTDPQDYSDIIKELKNNEGALSLETRRKLMLKAFNMTADYDAMIAMTMDQREGLNSLRLSFSQGQSLRYGENPHQKALFYKENGLSTSLHDLKLLHGKPLSFNNLMDVNSAIDGVSGLQRSACCVIKHNTPCGLAESSQQRVALEYAWKADPISAFGSVIAFNQPVEEKTVQFFELGNPDKGKRKFIEAIVAPSFTPEALEVLRLHKNLRVIEFPITQDSSFNDFKFIKGALLVQDADEQLFAEMQVPTKKSVDHISNPMMEFGLKAVRQVKSNAIVVIRELQDGTYQMLGMGAGQPNRLTSVSLAMDKCRQNLMEEFQNEQEILHELGRCLLVSEAFFPFPDSIDLCAKYGIKTIVQPGGSIKDKDVIAACDEHGIAMVLTGLRHFKH